MSVRISRDLRRFEIVVHLHYLHDMIQRITLVNVKLLNSRFVQLPSLSQ
jgi:hypothetical protein